MSNLQLLEQGNTSERVFANAINTLSKSQGYYCNIKEFVNSMNLNIFQSMRKNITKQDFKDTLDVVMYLET